jgi:signal transduction histidine kinase
MDPGMTDRILEEHAKQLLDSSLLNLGHELTITVNSMLGFAQLLNIGYNNLTGEQKEYLAGITDGGKHLFELSSLIADVIKLQYGALDVNLQPVELYPFLTRLCSENSGIAFQRRIDLFVDLGPETGTIRADEHRLARVIKNLLHNTIMFTEQDHKAGLKSLMVDGKAVIRIWNDSAPLEGEFLDQLLLPYAHKNHRFSIKRNSGSKGIGFYLVRKILELHNGTIRIENSNGRGNMFELTIPAV